ncbi:phosphatidylinositol alpha 1,6-mannosyltransferase [Rhodococcus wratislaviensis]|uniref:Glycosyl transferase n=1 Tax=Rhodococcus wratislaviensis TaxID=44752 RepID=A0AB38FLX0_RHOWR|nr:glycosyltransferase family 1 protein [Rhodococcus wratislaviensis]REE76233.1 phosphatidylinositol alpha 1,6-mannosyltransferase [Rhodococcus wratislaviensis]SPZ42355.1 glycosyl transferase [Rhodococcus wratislaviensis]
MRVAIVAESFLPNMNGVTNSVLRVLDHLQRTGHQAMVVAPDTVGSQTSAPTEHGGVPVHRVPAVMVPKVSSLPVGLPQPGLTAALRAFDPDVVHLASPFLLGAGGLGAAHRLDVPTVAVYQTDVAGFAESYGLGITSRAAWAWTRRIHRGCTRTLAPSTSAVEALAEQRIPRVHRWSRGVETARFAPSRRSTGLRDSWLDGSDRLVVGFVGRLAPEKHVERLAALSGDQRVQLVIVGDGPERARLRRLMPDAVFTGQLGGMELAEAYASLDVFVHPGEHETFCQAVQEALSSGVPVIGPDAGGPRDLVAHCRNGYLLPVDRFGELLPSAVEALSDRRMRARFGEAARQSVLHRTWPAICDELLGHYAAVTGGHGARESRAA